MVAGLQGLRDKCLANPAVNSWTNSAKDSLLPYLVQLLLSCTYSLHARILFLVAQREMIIDNPLSLTIRVPSQITLQNFFSLF